MQVWSVLHTARWKCRTKKSSKNRHLRTITRICRAISSQLRHILTIGKKTFKSHISSTCPHNMVYFGPLTAEIRWRVWSTPAIFNRFRVLGLTPSITHYYNHLLPSEAIIREAMMGHSTSVLVLCSCLGFRPSPMPQMPQQSPTFRPVSIVAKRSPISATSEHLLT